jgi:DNA-binding transcriptional MerR regulator
MNKRTRKFDEANHPVLIGDVSSELGLTLRALRFYEQKGLVKPKREGGFHRLFAEKDIERIRLIVTLKSLGLSLLEIRGVLAAPGNGPYGLTAQLCAELTKRMHARKTGAEAALAQLRKISRQFPKKGVSVALESRR